MPSDGTAALTKEPPGKASQNQQKFEFPPDSHLLITTARHIFAWDASGIQKVFESSRSGIAAARESKDGSGILAIASKNVVVLHDTRRGKEGSWGLNYVSEDVIRHIECAEDAKSIFLSTVADGAIQQYSTQRLRILDPVQRHASTPTALAVSPTGHLMVSASSSPPVVYIKNLAQNTPSTLIQPNSSSAKITCAAFHPDRPNVFMLAFADGSLAAYDASRTPRGIDGNATDAEIASLAGVHRSPIATDIASPALSTPIMGVAFLSGYKTRAVTAGRDGRCRIIDFANGGIILRTWHVKAPLTTIAVLAPGKSIDRLRRTDVSHDQRRAPEVDVNKPTELGNVENIIAIGRVDGKLHLYNDLGLLLTDQTVSSQEERVLCLEWVNGSSPKPPGDGDMGRFTDSPSLLLGDTPILSPAGLADQAKNATGQSGRRKPSSLGLPADLKSDKKDSILQVQRQFTVHPDELQDGTVRRNPTHIKQPSAVAPKRDFQDLFSPVKPQILKPNSPNRAASNSPRHRPRISSQTFVESSPPLAKSGTQQPTSSHSSELFRELNGSRKPVADRNAKVSKTPVLKPARRTSGARLASGADVSRRIMFNRRLVNTRDGTASSPEDPMCRNDMANAKLLADLRKLSRAGGTQQDVAFFSSYHNRGDVHHKFDGGTSNTIVSAYAYRGQLSNEPNEHCGRTMSNKADEPQQEDAGDIWLTSSEDEAAGPKSRRPKRVLVRPPARQCSRSHVQFPGTVSTIDTTPRSVQSSARDNTCTVRTQDLPIEVAPSSSKQIRELFPRSSSLSPSRVQDSEKRRSSQNETIGMKKATGQHTRSPWARVRAGKPETISAVKKSRSVRKNEFVTVLDGCSSHEQESLASPTLECLECPKNQAKVQRLQSEVIRLKAEALALKAVLRRNGLPIPAGLR